MQPEKEDEQRKEGSECEVSEFGETERSGGEEDDGDTEKCGGEGEGEFCGSEEVKGSLWRLQEIDDGDDNGDGDVWGRRFGAAFAVFLGFELAELSCSYCAGFHGDLATNVRNEKSPNER